MFQESTLRIRIHYLTHCKISIWIQFHPDLNSLKTNISYSLTKKYSALSSHWVFAPILLTTNHSKILLDTLTILLCFLHLASILVKAYSTVYEAHVLESTRPISMKWQPCPFQSVSRRAFKNYHCIRRKKEWSLLLRILHHMPSEMKNSRGLILVKSVEKCLSGWSRPLLLDREESQVLWFAKQILGKKSSGSFKSIWPPLSRWGPFTSMWQQGQ